MARTWSSGPSSTSMPRSSRSFDRSNGRTRNSWIRATASSSVRNVPLGTSTTSSGTGRGPPMDGDASPSSVPICVRSTSWRALDAVVARHEVLRTQIGTDEGEASPSIGGPRPVPLDVVEVPRGTLRTLDDAVALIQEFLVRPFDLSNDLLLRGMLVELGPDDHVLAMCVHHIASDGSSRQLLLDELGAYYVGFAAGTDEPILEEPSLQFSDVAAWQREALSDSRLDAAAEFWIDYLTGAPPTLDLPFDRARPSAQAYT